MTEATPANTRLTNAGFAKIAARIGKSCVGWAADSLDLPELRERPIKREAVRRFLAEIRDQLDYLERINARS